MSKLTDQVKETIRTKKILPRSQLSILAEQFSYAALFLVFFVILILGFNWLGFWLRSTGSAVFLSQGLLGIKVFFGGFPFILLVILGLAFGLTILLLRHYDISYKQPMLLLSVGLLVLAIVVGSGLSNLKFNDRIADRVDAGQLRSLAPIYGGRRSFSLHSERALVGQIKRITDEVIIVDTPRGEVSIEISGITKFRGQDLAQPGARLNALGRWIDKGQFEAEVVIVRAKISGGERKLLPEV